MKDTRLLSSLFVILFAGIIEIFCQEEIDVNYFQPKCKEDSIACHKLAQKIIEIKLRVLFVNTQDTITDRMFVDDSIAVFFEQLTGIKSAIHHQWHINDHVPTFENYISWLQWYGRNKEYVFYDIDNNKIILLE